MLSLKILIFFYCGGVNCIWPFLSLHLMHIGLTVDAIALLNFGLPIISLLGLSIGAYLIRVFPQQGKILVIISIVVSAVCFNIIYLMTPVGAQKTTPAKVLFHCDESGIRLVAGLGPKATSCTDMIREDHWIRASLHECECINETKEEYQQLGISAGRSTVKDERLCFRGTKFHVCNELHNVTHLRDLWLEYDAKNYVQGESDCEYKATRASLGHTRASSGYCLNCGFQCYARASVATPAEIVRAVGDGVHISWILQYFVVRAVAETATSAALYVIAGAEGNNDIAAVVGSGIFTSATGTLEDWWNEKGVEDFAPCFHMYTALMIISILTVLTLQEGPSGLCSNPCVRNSMVGLRMTFEITSLSVTTLVLGSLWGVSDTFLFPYLISICGSNTLVGLTYVSASVVAMPLIFKPYIVTQRTGGAVMIVVASMLMTVRFVSYLFMTNVLWSLLIEASRGICVHLLWMAILYHAATIMPDEKQKNYQIFAISLFYHLGRSLGSGLGGVLIYSTSFSITFMLAAITSGVITCYYCAVNVFCFFENSFE